MQKTVIEIKETNGNIYRISQKGTYKFLHEMPEGKGTSGKCPACFQYQILTHMVKMEPERFIINQDNGKQILGVNHMPVNTRDWIIRLGQICNFDREWDINRCEREISETQRTVDYDIEHGINTSFMGQPSGENIERIY